MRHILPTIGLSLALLPAATAAAAEPSVTISPKRVAHGESFTATGRGWASKAAVDRVLYFSVRGPRGERFHVGNATNSKHGRWTFTYKVKHYVGPGTWRLVVRQDRRTADGTVVKLKRRATFVVTH